MTIINLENKNKKSFFKSRKKLWIIVSIFLGLLIIGGGLLYAFGKGIFTKNWSGSSPFFRMLSGNEIKLKGEGDGRINVLFLGYGGNNHPGGTLTDTIQVISIDPDEKSMAMLSIPRDLYVEVRDPKYYGKINSVYYTGEKQTKQGGANLMKQEVGKILDLPIHYYVGLDFTGFKKAIDAVGGIDIDVDRAIYDPLFPNDSMTGYDPFRISAGEHHMNGETALKFTRSRETTSDFDRSARQQKVISAFKDKILSSGTLSNPEKVISLLNIAGSNIKTDFSVSEIKALANLLKDIDSSKTVSKVLDNGTNGPLISDSSSGTFYLKTKTGNWNEVQKIAHEIFTDPFLRKEKANIEIINSSEINGAAADLSVTLKSYGYNIVKVTNGEDTVGKTVIYDFTNGEKKYTLEFLSNRLSADILKKTKPDNSEIDIQIILGENHKTVYAKNKY